MLLCFFCGLYHDCGVILLSYHDCGNKELAMSESQSLHQKLSAADISFLAKFKLAVREGELDYWWQRDNPPNLALDIFRIFCRKLKREINLKWVDRESEAGPYGLTGEDQCFKFTHEISLMGVKKRYFVKGYFFNKGDLKGVTIQSFREEVNLKLL